MVMLTGFLQRSPPRDPPALTFGPGPNNIYRNLDQNTHNHVLHFRESFSTDTTSSVAYLQRPTTKVTDNPGQDIRQEQTPMFPGRTGYILRLLDTLWFPYIHVLHSQMLGVQGAGDSLDQYRYCGPWDFSLRSRGQRVQGDSAAPPYRVRVPI